MMTHNPDVPYNSMPVHSIIVAYGMPNDDRSPVTGAMMPETSGRFPTPMRRLVDSLTGDRGVSVPFKVPYLPFVTDGVSFSDVVLRTSSLRTCQ